MLNDNNDIHKFNIKEPKGFNKSRNGHNKITNENNSNRSF